MILFIPTLSLSKDNLKEITLPVFSSFFSLNNSSWSRYIGYDHFKKEFFHLKIGIKPENKKDTITFFLEEKANGFAKRVWAITYDIKDGDLAKIKNIILQLVKEKPVIFPEGLLKNGNGPVTFKKKDGFRLLKKANGKYKDKRLDLSWFIKKGKGRKKSKAILSHEVKPLGIVIFEGNDISLYLEDWGDSFKSPIEGRPVSLKKWLLIKGH